MNRVESASQTVNLDVYMVYLIECRIYRSKLTKIWNFKSWQRNLKTEGDQEDCKIMSKATANTCFTEDGFPLRLLIPPL